MILLLPHEKRRSHLTIKTFADITFQTVNDNFLSWIWLHSESLYTQ